MKARYGFRYFLGGPESFHEGEFLRLLIVISSSIYPATIATHSMVPCRRVSPTLTLEITDSRDVVARILIEPSVYTG